MAQWNCLLSIHRVVGIHPKLGERACSVANYLDREKEIERERERERERESNATREGVGEQEHFLGILLNA